MLWLDILFNSFVNLVLVHNLIRLVRSYVSVDHNVRLLILLVIEMRELILLFFDILETRWHPAI